MMMAMAKYATGGYCFSVRLSLTMACCWSLQDYGIPLNSDEIDFLLNELDKDGDGEINYR